MFPLLNQIYFPLLSIYSTNIILSNIPLFVTQKVSFLSLVQVYRPPRRIIDTMKAQFRFGDTVYRHPFVPGYEGNTHNHAGEG